MEKELQKSEILEGCLRNERKYQEILYKAYYPFFTDLVKDFHGDKIGLINKGFLGIFKEIASYDYETPFEEWITETFKESIKK